MTMATIKFSTVVDVPTDRRVTLTLPVDVPVGPAEIRVEWEPSTTDPMAGEGGPMTDPKLDREWAAFRAMLPELVKTYGGQFVAIHEGQVVGSGPDKDSVWREAHQRHGNVPILVRGVTETPRVVRIVTPFRRPPAPEA